MLVLTYIIDPILINGLLFRKMRLTVCAGGGFKRERNSLFGLRAIGLIYLLLHVEIPITQKADSFSDRCACMSALCLLSGRCRSRRLLLSSFTCLSVKLFSVNFQSLETVSRWRDPQLQVGGNYSDLTKWRSSMFKSCWLMSRFIFNVFETWYLMW